jgi:hypothetical protein
VNLAGLDRLVGEYASAEPATLTVHVAMDFVTGSPEPGFARLADRLGLVIGLIEQQPGESTKHFRGAAKALAEARGAVKLVFGGIHPRLAEHAALHAAVGAVNVNPADYRDVIRLPSGPLHSGEIEAILVAETHRFSAWKCGRRFGKTVTLIALAIDRALLGQLVGYFAPVYKLSSPTFKAIKHALAPIISTVNASDGLIEVMGGGSVETWTLEHPYAGRSRRYHLVQLDEAAFARDDLAEVYQQAIAPTLLDFTGSAILASTPHGIKPENFFFQACTSEEFGFLAGLYHAPSAKNPFLPAEELERLRKTNHPLIFRQEYEAQFVDLSGFGLFMTERMLQPNGEPWPTPAMLDYVYAVIDSGIKGGIEHDASAVIYFGMQRRDQRRLFVLDWEAVELGAASLEQWFISVAFRLKDYMKTIRIMHANRRVFVEPAGLGELLIAKFPGDAEPLDTRFVHRGKDGRALSVQTLVNGGSVRLTKSAYEQVSLLKGQRLNHLLSQLGAFRVGDKDGHKRQDDLLDCLTYGAIVGFEESINERDRLRTA